MDERGSPCGEPQGTVARITITKTKMKMTQDEIWNTRYNEIVAFIEREHRNPSKYYPEERGKYCNWLKHNKKLYNNGELKDERVPLFEELLRLSEQYKRKNQWI